MCLHMFQMVQQYIIIQIHLMLQGNVYINATYDMLITNLDCHKWTRGIYSSIYADAAWCFTGENSGQNVIKKWFLGKKSGYY